MKVQDIMTANARCVAPDNTLVEVGGLMRQLDVGALPVLENDQLAGMVTDRDIVVRGVADGRDPNTAQVREVMSPGIFSVFSDQSVEEAVRVMEQKQVRRLPVLDRNQRLVGIVALGDIAVASNPAFSGMALREVSESEQTMSHRGSQAATPGQRLSKPEDVTNPSDESGQASRGPEGASNGADRGEAKKASTRSRSGPVKKKTAARRGATKSAARKPAKKAAGQKRRPKSARSRK